MVLSDSVGRIVEKYQYAVYGNPQILNQNNKHLTESKYGNPYMFTGRRFDSETRLYYYRARYYSTEIGRFLQVDPIGYEDSMNLYIYVGNNPIVWIDPYGLCRGDRVDYGDFGLDVWARELGIGFLEGLAEPYIDFGRSGGDYYRTFREDYGPVGASLHTTNMMVGKVVGYSTLAEGLVGVDARTVELLSTRDRVIRTTVGTVQTAVSAVLLAEGLHAATTKTVVETRPTLGADGATSQIIKTKSRITGKTLKVEHKVTLDGRVLHKDQKFP